jgi:hypothetical protein
MDTLLPPKKNESHAWYREPWLLLVIGGPAAVVCASLYTGFLAYHSSDRVVAEDYYRQGLMVNKDIERDAKARERNMAAVIKFNGEHLEMQLTGQGAFPDTVQISVAVADDTSVNEIIRRLPMQQTQNGTYVSATSLPQSANGKRARLMHVKVETTDWRLTGDWFEPEQSALHLHAS